MDEADYGEQMKVYRIRPVTVQRASATARRVRIRHRTRQRAIHATPATTPTPGRRPATYATRLDSALTASTRRLARLAAGDTTSIPPPVPAHVRREGAV